ncbi:hypothetical protein Tco_0720730 [Tanacetum coccineum]
MRSSSSSINEGGIWGYGYRGKEWWAKVEGRRGGEAGTSCVQCFNEGEVGYVVMCYGMLVGGSRVFQGSGRRVVGLGYLGFDVRRFVRRYLRGPLEQGVGCGDGLLVSFGVFMEVGYDEKGLVGGWRIEHEDRPGKTRQSMPECGVATAIYLGIVGESEAQYLMSESALGTGQFGWGCPMIVWSETKIFDTEDIMQTEQLTYLIVERT